MAPGLDEDDFDWEAAVAEIDDACLKTQQTNPQPNSSDLASDIDPTTATTWIYPTNIPYRQYQFSITKTALFTNTLVSLPTGLGKTLIAAVVMYNYYRWFPTGKIVFTAPSRPLVMQQIEACHNIMGIPQEMTIDMTGQMSPPQRADHWQIQRVFFVTPQCLEKDIHSGTCPVKDMVCLVVDEAHRATGNFSYCIVTRELLAANAKLRILAMTATPGSKQVTIQAVVDNLSMSCLEYRDENDPDVSQYTHNRKLELIQVAMNAESNKIKDIFLEILMPVVDKLCKLGVFYSRELARLSPFEFITARERFRQAPPQSLGQSQYREVESFFSIAITLYHIFKLLHSHGIRPALEMLQAKLQEGTLRILARNNKLHEIKNLMQESVGHGAPSPKLVKMEEIILSHFHEHDPLTTRVIIFTNFRESVKDILESLSKVGHIVKAMEFIGQSSGKASKGQTQKMQQAVLQKFRAGGYNTIVATSIAEEGLDIMEVDLVICFDANVSPLRMVQRMGRTGRKRDGRVALVLASEGSEMQGYLKKQAKNKALGKHMQHGGINSFNFHPSPRMVPHTYKPKPQMMEMRIEQYVHRGKKQCVEGAAIPDPEIDELTEEEQALLRKYALPPDAEPWKPSLIAFPRYQLLPTPIHSVKHSNRTTSMFIDVLRGLQEPGFFPAGKECLPSQLEVSSLNKILQNSKEKYTLSVESAGGEEPTDAKGTSEIDLDNSGTAPDHETPQKDLQDNINSVPEAIAAELNPPYTEQIVSRFNSSSPAVNTKDGAIYSTQTEQVVNKLTSAALLVYKTDGEIYTPLAEQIVSKAPSVVPLINITEDEISLVLTPKEEIVPITKSVEVFSHQFLFNTQFVYKNSAGVLEVASPPKWQPRQSTTSLDDQLREEEFSSQPESPSQSLFIATTPEDKLPQASTIGTSYPGIVTEITAETFTSPVPKSPQTCIPSSSPILETPFIPKHEVTPPCKPTLLPSFPHTSSLEKWSVASTSKQMHDKVTRFTSALDNMSNIPRTEHSTYQAGKRATLSSVHVHQAYQSPAKPKALDFGDSIYEEPPLVRTQTGKSPMFPELPVSKAALTAQTQETLQGRLQLQQTGGPKRLHTSQIQGPKPNPGPSCSSHEVHGLSRETPPSEQRRPRKFKRLKKARELVCFTPSSGNKRRLRDDCPSENTKLPQEKRSKLGKLQRKLTVQPFIDEEAEVSSDEEISTDDSEGDSQEEATQDGFIDTSHTQHLHFGSVDMMAVYRRSLLTQSPIGGGSPGITTPTATTSATLASSDTGGSHSKQRVEPSSVSRICCSAPTVAVHNVNVTPFGHFKHPGGETETSSGRFKERVRPTSLQTAQDAETNDSWKLEHRKRKLSFQFQEDEDDVFAGLDLDALEEEATQLARARQTQATYPSTVMPSFDLGIDG